MTKKCEFCVKPIDIRSEPYANIYPNPKKGAKMQSYHLVCLNMALELTAIKEVHQNGA